jgi:hypothetical protein
LAFIRKYSKTIQTDPICAGQSTSTTLVAVSKKSQLITARKIPHHKKLPIAQNMTQRQEKKNLGPSARTRTAHRQTLNVESGDDILGVRIVEGNDVVAFEKRGRCWVERGFWSRHGFLFCVRFLVRA